MTDLDAATLAAIIESSGDAIVTKTLDGIVTSWNPAAEQIFGYPAREMVGRSITTLFPPDRLGEETEFQRRMLAGQRVDHFETVRVTKDGALIDVSVNLSPIRAADGRILGISKIARDISARKAAEARLRAHERLLHITLASIGDAVVTTDTPGRVTFLNPVAERLTGWPLAEGMGREVLEVMRLVNERTGRPAENPVVRVLREGIVVGLANHTAIIARDGTRRPIEDSGAPIVDEHGRLFGAVLVFHDITARRAIERDLQRLASIVASSDDAIVGKTTEGIITSWNAGAERIFGYPAAEVVGRPITVLLPPDRAAEEIMFLEAIARGEQISHFETVRIRKDGRRISVSVTLSPIRDEDGAVVGISKIARDITEGVELRAREGEAYRQAAEANRVKDEFLATLSHELRTPLGSIFGWIRMLQAGHLDGDRTRHALTVMERNCRAQMALISDLLDMSRVVTGRIRLDLRSVDLAEVVRTALDGARPTALAKSIEIAFQPAAGVPRVAADPERMQQVVWNLLSNAVKFTDTGGRVEVGVERADAGARLWVTDTGIGIAPDLLPHIFDAFRQADSSATRTHGGLGLGLAIVRQLVELHGGTVAATSDGPGHGTTFTVTLPSAVAHLAQVSARPPAPTEVGGQPLAGARIVVVDDDPDSRDLVATVFRGAGAAVAAAESVPEAMRFIVEQRPALVVTDLGMPAHGGIELIALVRALRDPTLAATPMVALTAYAGSPDEERVRNAGFDVFLTKPVEPAELISAAARALQRSRRP
ncbi:MAG TPA: PAS domain S-box protein [Methylomirabilota bacterium]|jgi:PAS domain S-box-containing protein